MTTHATLDELLRGFADAPAIPITGISSDSRALRAGNLFLACRGASHHGLDFVDDALAAGVAAIAWDSSTGEAPRSAIEIPMVGVPNLANHLGEIANRYHHRPSDSVKVTGVTGTNGKTTVAWLLAQCCERLGEQCGYIGTLGVGVGEIADSAGLTTPGTLQLHQHLADFREAGAGHAAIEVSSHALDQRRIDGISFDTVLFTNLSRDHLDYHGDMQSYAEAKAKLFIDYPARHRIINIDSDYGEELADRCGNDVVAVSTCCDRLANGRRHVCARSVAASDAGSRITFESSWGGGELLIPLPGDFNVANALIVLAALLARGVAKDEACRALQSVTAPPGRMERVPAGTDKPAVYIDYAHTPEALGAALQALRPHCSGDLWCVFGCGGDRDPGKRPLMASIAETRADRVVITSDNPRSEEPVSIIEDIVAGMARPEAATILEDRAVAIAWAIEHAGPADTVLVAGKGHEEYQLVGTERREFSDFGVALAGLGEPVEGAG